MTEVDYNVLQVLQSATEVYYKVFYLYYIYSQTSCLLYILFIRCKLYAAVVISLQFVYCYYVYYHHIVYMCVYILMKSFFIYLIEHSSH